jgi:hypothetical protein
MDHLFDLEPWLADVESLYYDSALLLNTFAYEVAIISDLVKFL